VVGGGVAGVAAALAASRRGLSVALVEKEPSLGGTATLGLTGTICGLYRSGTAEPGELLNGGIVAEVVAALLAKAPARSVRRAGRVFVLPYESGELQEILETLCAGEESLTVYRGATVVAIAVAAGAVRSATVSMDESSFVFAPAALVDASGSGEAACLAGAAFELTPAEQLQLAGFTVKIAGLQGADASLSLKVPFAVAKGIEAGRLPVALRYTVFTAAERPTEGLLKVNIPEGSDVAGAVAPLVGYLAAELAEFSQAVVTATSARSFSREGRRILGSSLLTADDVLSARKCADGVVKGAWPIELWSRDRGVSYRYPPDGDYYEIPAGCLKARGFSNLFMAGRCISVSHEALGSTRVIGTCLALGEQAGLAAANCITSFSR
jgi:hypothetical protein